MYDDESQVCHVMYDDDLLICHDEMLYVCHVTIMPCSPDAILCIDVPLLLVCYFSIGCHLLYLCHELQIRHTYTLMPSLYFCHDLVYVIDLISCHWI